MMEETNTSNPFVEENTQANQGVKWLLTHAWNIITKENLFKGRLSRGEYRIVTLLFGAATNLIGLVLSQLGVVGMIISGIIGLAALVYHIGFGIKRSHDLNKSGWYGNMPLIALVLVMAILAVTMLIGTDGMFAAGILGPILGLGALIRLMIVGIKLSFYKGTVGDNAYGADRLPAQPTTNGMYWGIGIALAVLSVIFSGLNPNQQTQNDTFEQMIQQKIGVQNSDDINTTNYPQINIDDSMSDQDIVDQIDTGIQTEDASALSEVEAIDNTTTEATETIN